jgi:hypothetical protein
MVFCMLRAPIDSLSMAAAWSCVRVRNGAAIAKLDELSIGAGFCNRDRLMD